MGDGMATDLTTTLAGMTGLHVVSRSSAFALRGKTAREAGALLTADAMVEGTVGKVENRLRVTVSLVNVADEAVLWSQRYDVTEKDLYALQDSAAAAIASALGVGLGRRDDPALAAHRTANPEAHDLVLRGQFLTEQNTEASLHQAIALFERAATLDSTYADPWNGIAQAWFFLARVDPVTAARLESTDVCRDRQGAALDPRSAWRTHSREACSPRISVTTRPGNGSISRQSPWTVPRHSAATMAGCCIRAAWTIRHWPFFAGRGGTIRLPSRRSMESWPS
jgi:TolB-like protein